MTVQKLMLAFALGAVVELLSQVAYNSFSLAWRLLFGATGAALLLVAFYVGTRVNRQEPKRREDKRENQGH